MRRRMLMTLAAAGLAAPALAQVSRTVVYGDTTTNIPRSRTWNGSAWSGAAATLDIGGSPRWVVLQKCPTRDELIAAIGDNQNDLNMMVYVGSTWGSRVEVSGNLVTEADRPFYVAYEQSSGDALVAYRVGSVSTIFYRTWNGSSWSAESSTSIPGSGNPKFVKLVPKAGSDEIMLVVLDSKKDVSALIWNGSSFGNKLLLDSSTNVAGNEEMDAAYEHNSGRCMIAWGVNGNSPPSYRIWSGSAWLSTGSLSSVGGKTNWIRLAPDPASNRIIAMVLNGGCDVNAAVWSGTAWGAATAFESNAPDMDRRGIDVAFEPARTNALAMYGRSGQSTPFYRTFNGTSWSAAQTGPNMSNPPSVIQFSPSTSGQEVLIGIERKNDGAFCFMRWNGTSITDYQVLASDLGGPNGNECFMFSQGAAGSSSTPRIVSWQEVGPGS